MFLSIEHTLVLLKPDCAGRRLVGQCLSYFEKIKELEIHDFRCIQKRERLTVFDHYSHLPSEIVEEIFLYFSVPYPMFAIEFRGPGAIAVARAVIGATDPATAEKGTIRGDLGIDSFEKAKLRPPGQRALRNLVHASDSLENSHRELKLWLP